MRGKSWKRLIIHLSLSYIGRFNPRQSCSLSWTCAQAAKCSFTLEKFKNLLRTRHDFTLRSCCSDLSIFTLTTLFIEILNLKIFLLTQMDILKLQISVFQKLFQDDSVHIPFADLRSTCAQRFSLAKVTIEKLTFTVWVPCFMNLWSASLRTSTKTTMKSTKELLTVSPSTKNTIFRRVSRIFCDVSCKRIRQNDTKK